MNTDKEGKRTMPDTNILDTTKLDSKQQIELTLWAAKMASSALALVGVKDKRLAQVCLNKLMREATETFEIVLDLK
jgi:hypothetical protein